MIRLLLSLFLIGVIYRTAAQNKQLLYDFQEIPQSLMVNPGTNVDFQWYAGIPGLSAVSLQAGSSGISVNDLFANDGIDINTKVRERMLGSMTTRDELSGTFQVSLFEGGFRAANADTFYSFGMYIEGDAIGYWFKDYAILAFEGNADYRGKPFDLGHFKTRGEMVNVLHVGVNRRVDHKLTLGGRLKFYSGIFDFNSTHNKGYFVTTEGERNLLASTMDADLRMRTSGLDALENAYDDGNLAQTLVKRGFFGGDPGLGVDLGFSYNLDDHTVVTGSLLDLGFTYHSNNIRTFTINGSATVEGIEVVIPDGNPPDYDYWEALVQRVEDAIPFVEDHNAYMTMRPLKLYASVRRDFGEALKKRGYCECGANAGTDTRRARFANSVGGQLYVVNRPRGPQAALTAFYLRRFGDVATAKVTYTVDKFTKTNVGLGMSVNAGPVNIYLLADNLFSYTNIAASRYASFQLGLNILSWGDKVR